MLLLKIDETNKFNKYQCKKNKSFLKKKVQTLKPSGKQKNRQTCVTSESDMFKSVF